MKFTAEEKETAIKVLMGSKVVLNRAISLADWFNLEEGSKERKDFIKRECRVQAEKLIK